MTVVYCDKVASHGGFGSFFKLLLKWRGSVYKMVWQDMLVFLVLYYAITLIYRFALPEENMRVFEMVVVHCAKFRNLIPISFVLGFFVSLVVSRWWSTYKSIPWPDVLAITLSTYITGQDPESKNVRATILRYANLTIALTFAKISPAVQRKLPNLQQFIVAGYLTDVEKIALDNMELKTKQHKLWVPITWACKTLQKARNDEVVVNDSHQRLIAAEIMAIRSQCGGLLGFSCYNIPLVYTQVVTIAVYSFFIFSLIGEQYLDPEQGIPTHLIDLYFPMFALLQLFFYIGWLKVAEALLNPFGEDDHDFEFNSMLQRHREVSNMLSEADKNELPPHLQELYGSEVTSNSVEP
ncbi:bestrophin-2-like [Macrobrachium rosenbergii]|uniref:bestrophin-2-like n=1 Tax=Macrobrachium rosenbergii TaxID=79674 RepID=UPI0034D674DD